MGFEREYCLCGIHVHTGSRIIAITFLVLSAINFLLKTASIGNQSSHHHLVILLFITFLANLPNILLLYGHANRRPAFYWPFIIWHSILVAITFLVGAVILIYGSVMLDSIMPAIPGSEHPRQRDFARSVGSAMTTAVIIAAVIYFVLGAIYAYLVSVVVRGYNFICENAAAPQHEMDRLHAPPPKHFVIPEYSPKNQPPAYEDGEMVVVAHKK